MNNFHLHKLNLKLVTSFLWACLLILNPLSVPMAGAQTVFQDNKPPSTSEMDTLPTSAVIIPRLSDWQPGSLAFSRGSPGEWDHYLYGGFANSLIKKGNTYYLYYQGATSYDNHCDSVAFRGIGVATSTDGIHWVKSTKNPVITWSSQGSIEEGAVSSAAWLGSDGKIYMYYGANTGSDCNVHANARLAVSVNGEDFQDAGQVISGRDPNIWGSGDEIFPLGAYSFENKWYLYYTPNGVSLSRKLGVGIGGSPTSFTQTLGVNNSTISAWGPVSVIPGSPDSVLVTNPNGVNGPLNFYRFNAANPSVVQLSDSYTLSNCTQASIIYESSTGRWMMSCRDQNAENYYIRSAYPAPAFADVPTSHPFYRYIEAFYDAGITMGCSQSPRRFCPDNLVTRGEMAVFIERAMGNFNPQPDPSGMFRDLPYPGLEAFTPFIEEFYNDRITTGCRQNPLRYCPQNNVTRGEMAVFIERAIGHFSPPTNAVHPFVDVPYPGLEHFTNFIEQFYYDGITTGCQQNPRRYCPQNNVTRGEMAVFIVRAFRIPIP